jgi:alpha-tubulin suppressor-like RCC1 family protein
MYLALTLAATHALLPASAAHAQPTQLGPVAQQIGYGGSAAPNSCLLDAVGGVVCDSFFYGLMTYFNPANALALSPDRITMITTHQRGYCGLVESGTDLGKVKCWLDAPFTSLGNPPIVMIDASDIVTLGRGLSHVCGVRKNGAVRCAGGFDGGAQVGLPDADGDLQLTTSPSTKLRSIALAGGYNHHCALTPEGRVYCWYLGPSLPAEVQFPTDVRVTAISSSDDWVCALTTTGRVYCWGRVNFNGTVFNDPTPTLVEGVNGATAIANGPHHACAIAAGGGVKCWGLRGGLGIGGPYGGPFESVAIDTPSLDRDIIALDSSTDPGSFTPGTCAVSRIGKASCWGADSLAPPYAWAQFPQGLPFPTQYPFTSTDVLSVDASVTSGACARMSYGQVRCWGNGWLGTGFASTGAQQPPVTPAGFDVGVKSLVTNQNLSCAVNRDGAVLCWTGATGLPTVSGGITGGASQVTVAMRHICALVNGGVKCWSRNPSDGTAANGAGQLGIGNTNPTTATVDVIDPTSANGKLSGVTALSGRSQFHTCAIAAGNVVKCWGQNAVGQLGYDTAPDQFSATPKAAMIGSGPSAVPLTATAIAVGTGHSCALRSDGSVWCWGGNSKGQLGDGTQINRTQPAPVSGLGGNATAIAVGTSFSCALMSGGNVKCWGANEFGELGDGSTPSNTAFSATPVDVVGVTGATSLSVSAGVRPFGCAYTPSVGLQCWGNNSGGQLGDGTTTNRNTPVVAWRADALDWTPPAFLSATGATALTGATSMSGAPVTYDTWTPGACTVSGDTTNGFTVTPLAGSMVCGVRASVSGVPGRAPAPPKLAVLQVTDAACGGASGMRVNTPPSANLCAIGTADTVVKGPSSYVWNCASTTAGANGVAACSAPFARLNVDASDGASFYSAGSDGTILLRYLFGFRDGNLTAGALGTNPQRNTAQIEAHFAENIDAFDVDGDGKTLPLSDGLMILRGMLGITGNALTVGAKQTARTDEAVLEMIARLKP